MIMYMYVSNIVLVHSISHFSDTMMFRQAVLSPTLSKHFKVFELSNSDLLPSNVQQHVRNDLHVWIVTDRQWSHLLLLYWNKVFQDTLHHLIGVFINLQHPVKVAIMINISTCMHTCTFSVYYCVTSSKLFPTVSIYHPCNRRL